MKKITILFALVLASCGSFKIKETQQVIRSKQTNSVKKDSVQSMVINGSISDALEIPVVASNSYSKEKDSLINSKVDEILSKINTTKTSGNNSYSLYYDLEKRLINLQTTIGETRNINTATNNSTEASSTLEEKTDKYISKKIKSIPWYMYLLAVLWFLPQILERLNIIVNPINAFLNQFKQHNAKE